MRILLTLFFLLLIDYSYSQTVTGSWYGKADVASGNANNYLTELIIKQKGDEVEGIFGYYFRDGYKSLFFRGTYNKENREFMIKKIPVVYYRSTSIDGVDCFMDFMGVLMVSKVESRIKGVFRSHAKYQNTCPDLMVSYVLDAGEKNQDSLIRNSIARKLWQPRQEDLVITNTSASAKSDNVDSSKAAQVPMIKMEEVFSKRQNILAKEIEIESDSVRVSFYDNGDVDQDSISVFLNGHPVVSKQELTAEALNIYLKLDSSREVNEISMFAENLGKFPPNTALMIVNDGNNRYEVYLSSSLTQNSGVRLKRKKR